MPLVLADRVNETTTTTSTGAVTLAGAVSGYQSFAVIGNANTTYYTIVHQTASEWEVGIGTYTSSGTTLSRDTVLASSNSGSLVNFSAGIKFVFCDYPAGRAVYLDTATNVTIPGLTLSGGTANGVLYLNGSKVATSGTGLTFNGTTLVATDITDSSLTSGRVTYAGASGNLVDSANMTFNGTTLTVADIADSSLTAGRVTYAGASGNLVDSANLTFSGTNLGVGTASPAVRLDVQSAFGATPGFANNAARFLSTATAAVGVGGSIVLGGKTGNLTADWAFAGLQGVKESATASNYSGSLLFLTQNSVGSTSLTEWMRLTAAGDLGIGTASPNNKLDVRGVITTGNGTVRMALSSTAADGIVGTLSNHGLFFYTNNTTRAFLDTSGSLGLGTTTSRGDLDVSSGATTTAITKSVHLGYSSANFYGFRLANTNTAGSFFAGTFSIQRGTGAAWSDDFAVNNSGNVGIGTSSPITKLDVRSDAAVVATSGYSSLHFNALPASATARAATIRKNYDSPFDLNIYASTGTSGNSAATIFYRDITNESMRLDSSGRLGIGTDSNALTNVLTLYRTGSTQSAMAAGNSNTGLNGTLFGVDTTGNGIINQTQALPLIFSTSNTERMRLNASGNLGLGVTPSAWGSTWKALQISNWASLGAETSSTGECTLLQNAYASGASTFNYIGSFAATRYTLENSAHKWYTAPSGTAGNTISFTQAMTLDASGNLGIGTSSPATRIHAERSTDGVIGTFRGTSTAQYLVGIASGVVTHDASNGSATHTWQTNGTERARLDSSGNLGIGTSSPGAKLEAYRSSSGEVARFTASADGVRSLKFISSDNTGSGAVWTRDIDSAFAQHRWAKSGTPLMVLDESGNLGIGTSSPGERLDVVGGGLGVGNGTIKTVVSYTTEGIVGTTSNHALLLYANNAERARITSGGNFGIGTTAPVNKLSVLGFISASDSNFTASAYIHASPDSGANRNIGQFSVTGASNGLQINWNHASSKMHIIINNIPTSSAGLPSGTLYSDGGTIKIA